MAILKLKIDLEGTTGDEAWRRIKHFDPVQAAFFGPEFGSSGPCTHAPDAPHTQGEWRGAEVLLSTSLLAQYAMAHYLEQQGVLDADIEE